MSTRRRVYPQERTFKSDIRFLPFYVCFTPETYRHISKVRQATIDPFRTFKFRGFAGQAERNIVTNWAPCCCNEPKRLL